MWRLSLKSTLFGVDPNFAAMNFEAEMRYKKNPRLWRIKKYLEIVGIEALAKPIFVRGFAPSKEAAQPLRQSGADEVRTHDL